MTYNELRAVVREQRLYFLRAVLNLHDLNITSFACDQKVVGFFERAHPVVAVFCREGLAPVHADGKHKQGHQRQERHYDIGPEGTELEQFYLQHHC